MTYVKFPLPRKALTAAATSLLLLGLGAGWILGSNTAVAAPDEPPVEAPAAPAPKAPATPKLPIQGAQIDWYGIYMEGNKIGWARMAVEPVKRDGKLLIRTHYRIEMRMQALGTTKELAVEEELLFASAAPYAVVSGWNLAKQGAFSKRVELRGRRGAFKGVITAGGQTRTLDLPEDPCNFLVAMKPFFWLREPRKVGDKVSYRSFNLGDLEFDDEDLTVTKVETTVVDGVPFTFYVGRHHSKRDGSVGTMRVDQTGKLLSMQLMEVMEIRLESERVAKQPGKPVDLFVSRVARIDKPLGKASEVVDLVLEVRGPGIERVTDGPRQRASYDADRKVLTLKLGRKHDPRVKATEEEVRECTAEDAGHPTRAANIVALATRAIGGAQTPRARVARLVAFVDEYIEDSYSAEPLTVLDILEVRKGDCTEHSLLFTTLARAVGVPAREVGGLMYMGDEIQIGGACGFGGHAWNEVVLDGIWVPVDATWGQTEVDATHIRQAAENQNQAAAMTLGGAQLTLISIERREK